MEIIFLLLRVLSLLNLICRVKHCCFFVSVLSILQLLTQELFLFSLTQLKNPSELLTLLHHTGRLRDASILARDYLLAVLGHGKEHFGFQHSLTPTGPAFCAPVYKIAMLLEELRTVNMNDPERPLAKVGIIF